MKSAWFGLGLLIVATAASGDTVARLVDRASEVYGGYGITVAQYELAMLRYEVDLETSETVDEAVTIELTRLSALSSYRNSLESYYNEVIDAVFDMGVATLDLQAAQLSDRIAQSDLAYARSRYDKGLISTNDLTEVELSYREQKNSLAQAEFDEQEARNDLRLATGTDWDPSLLPDVPGTLSNTAVRTWIDSDLSYQQALLKESQAEQRADNPTGTVSEFDQMAADIEVETARLNTRNRATSAEQEYRKMLRSIESDGVSLEIQSARLALQQQLLVDANVRLERGMITPTIRDQQQVRLLQTDASYLQSLRRYIKQIIAYNVHTGAALDEI